MEKTFKQFLVEDAKTRASTKRIADMINSATSGKFNATVATKTGGTNSVLAITTKDGKIPAAVDNVFRQHKIGVGDKESVKNKDGTVTIKFTTMEM